jgi:putative DNA primase/helicase
MGKIANISYDSGNVIKVGSEAIFKQYCSGEPLKAKILYKQHTETTSYPKSLIAVNELPQSADFSDGFYRRFLIVEFQRQIPIEQVDVNLFDKLKKEQVGILLWIIEGYKRLKSNGRFTESESTKQAMEDYRTNSDNVKIFLREMGWRKSDKKVKLSNLYSIYKEWAEKNGYRNPVASTKFGVRLRLLQFEVKASTGNITYVWAEQEERPIEVDDNAPF